MRPNSNRAYIVLLEDSFDVASNYYLVDSYLSLLALTSDSNEKTLKFLAENDPIWSQSFLQPFQAVIQNFKEQHEKMADHQKDKESLAQRFVSEIIQKQIGWLSGHFQTVLRINQFIKDYPIMKLLDLQKQLILKKP